MNTSFLDDIFTISHGGKDVIERKDSNNKILWERAISKTTNKSASITLTNTRKTGGNGVTYPIFTPSKVLPSVVAYGKCAQSGTPTPTIPVDIVCNNGTIKALGQTAYVEGTSEVITAQGKNLNGGTLGHMGYSSTGQTSESSTFAGTLSQIPTAEGEKFTISYGNIPSGISGVFINTWLTDGTWNMRQAIAAVSTLTYTVGAGVGLINFTLYKTGGIELTNSSWMQVEYGATPTAYSPYVTPQTASVTDLFAVGEYEDTQDIMTGVVTRNVGIEIFDGTEDWKSGNNTGLYYISLTGKKYEKSLLVSTHFVYSSTTSTQIVHGEMMCGSASANTYFRNTDCNTLEDWKTWLATQYSAGTPVMVVYPLATPQTEQALLSEQIELDHKDTYTLSTSGSVSNLLIQATYLGR